MSDEDDTQDGDENHESQDGYRDKHNLLVDLEEVPNFLTMFREPSADGFVCKQCVEDIHHSSCPKPEGDEHPEFDVEPIDTIPEPTTPSRFEGVEQGHE